MTQGALNVLETWLPTLAQMVNNDGYAGALVAPKTYGRIPTSQIEQTADQVPAVYIATPGTTGTPVRSANNSSWESWYTLNVLVVDRDEDWELTTERIAIWAALVRSALLSDKSLRGMVADVAFLSETYGAIPDDQGRTYAGVVVAFRVLVPNVTILGDIGPLSQLPSGAVDPVTGLPTTTLPTGPVVVSHEEDFFNGPV